MFPRVGLLLIAVAPLIGRAEEAVRPDGTVVAGRLDWRGESLQFIGPNGPVAVAGLERIRFNAVAPVPTAALLWHRLELAGDQRLTVQILRADDKVLRVRTAWGPEIAIPRSAIERGTFGPAGRPVLVEQFEAGLSRWKAIGQPKAGPGPLVLTESGQAIEWTAPRLVTAGRIDVLADGGPTSTRPWTVEADLERNKETTRATALSASPVTSIWFDASGWEAFSGERLVRSERTPIAGLKAVRLRAGEGSGTATIRGILISQAAVPSQPKPWGNLTRDAVRSTSGDETYGTIDSLDDKGLTRGRRSVSWEEAVEWTFRRGPWAEQGTSGEHVRLRIRTVDRECDVVEGSLARFDARGIHVRHAVLGDCVVPRAYVEEIALRFHGRTVPLTNEPFHLGTRPAFGVAAPKPGGLRWARSVTLERPLGEAFLMIEAAGVDAKGPACEVRVNGLLIGRLQDEGRAAVGRVRPYRFGIRQDGLREGANEVEIILREAGGRGVDLRAVRMEVPTPR